MGFLPRFMGFPMNIYKVKPGAFPDRDLNRNNFEEDTNKRSPYYVNEDVQYAVCPKCNNPIQLIGLYKRLAHTPKPYGRHIPRSIEGLAIYSQEAFDRCPFVRPQEPNPDAKRTSRAGIPQTLLQLLSDQFDRIGYVLSRDTGIYFSSNLLKKMLKTFLAVDGILYPWAVEGNLPWMFGYRAQSKKLYGQKLRLDCQLRTNILAKVPNVRFDENDRLVQLEGYLQPIVFCFMHHNFSEDGERETIRFLVTQVLGGLPADDLIIHDEVIEINQRYFLDLINRPRPEKGAKQSQNLLGIAQEMLRNHLKAQA